MCSPGAWRVSLPHSHAVLGIGQLSDGMTLHLQIAMPFSSSEYSQQAKPQPVFMLLVGR